MATEKEELLNLLLDSIEIPEKKRVQIDVNRDKQRYLAAPGSRWEVTLSGKAISGEGEEFDFDKAIHLFDVMLKRHTLEVAIIHILNGTRTVVLRSPVVKVKDHPSNPIGIAWEDE